ncbi:hypothetical protein C5167_027755 [Papaver somniferum]|uniref:uncharacterized protein LOC113339271 n=1 Tax=Papaver somniferum TaxID=3469 RepID=UPI000E6FCDB0|nr:uncharacterized protein LOC113339271 [Papaver somniferum]RZC91693.1 hypothetical protein C5167_027755 [Papaver somniferum]
MMADQIDELEGELVVQCDADKLYTAITSGAPSLPKYLPQLIHKCQIFPGGCEISVGSIFVWDYVIEGKSSTVTTKEKITAVDHKNMLITCTVFEGDTAISYPSFATTVQITPIGGGSNESKVKWSIKYEIKKSEHDVIPTPTSFVNFLETFFIELGVKLLEEEKS